jgi:DNA-binding CsgD family transcriptional regulator
MPIDELAPGVAHGDARAEGRDGRGGCCNGERTGQPLRRERGGQNERESASRGHEKHAGETLVPIDRGVADDRFDAILLGIPGPQRDQRAAYDDGLKKRRDQERASCDRAAEQSDDERRHDDGDDNGDPPMGCGRWRRGAEARTLQCPFVVVHDEIGHPALGAPSDKGSTTKQVVDMAAEFEPDPPFDVGPRASVEAGVLLMIAALLSLDLLSDARTGKSLLHVTFELAATLVALLALVFVWRIWARARRGLEGRIVRLRGQLDASRAEAGRWKAEARDALAGLGAAIDQQCDRWNLTEAERSVALLLLKGLSFKEIAAARHTSERTARQQALAVYKKAGLAGRAELAAFFLEDLLLPSEHPAP